MGWIPAPLLTFCIAVLGIAFDAHSQTSFGGTYEAVGTAEYDSAPLESKAEGAGSIVGNVFDAATGAPVRGATVIVIWPSSDAGAEAHQEIDVSNDGGAFRFAAIPTGAYTLSFIKSGYRSATMTGFEVVEGQVSQADFPLSPIAAAESGDIFDLDAFVVEASTVDDVIGGLELRMDSDIQLDVMTADDLEKFSASDVAEALKRVAGVNVVEGKFAIIRGLEDRYSSILYNGAPVPSPDPLSQSVQLDLFPSEVVSDLAIAKTFSPELPSNSSGGSINILTRGVPDKLEV